MKATVYKTELSRVIETERTAPHADHLCHYHDWFGLSLRTNQSGLKIVSAISHPLSAGERPPALREVRLLLILLRSVGRKEVLSRGGGGHAKEGRKRTADQAQSLCPVHITRQTTYGCSHAQNSLKSLILTAHVNMHIPSPVMIKYMSLPTERNCYLTLARLGRGWVLSVVRRWSRHVYWIKQRKCGLEQLDNENQPRERGIAVGRKEVVKFCVTQIFPKVKLVLWGFSKATIC